MTDQTTPEDQDDAEAARAALTGSDAGSDTRAGSLQGGSATGSERDEAQVASDKYLADLGPGLKAAGGGKPGTPKD